MQLKSRQHRQRAAPCAMLLLLSIFFTINLSIHHPVYLLFYFPLVSFLCFFNSHCLHISLDSCHRPFQEHTGTSRNITITKKMDHFNKILFLSSISSMVTLQWNRVRCLASPGRVAILCKVARTGAIQPARPWGQVWAIVWIVPQDMSVDLHCLLCPHVTADQGKKEYTHTSLSRSSCIEGNI